MSSLLIKTNLPLWVWIVIIAIGSVVVLGTFAFVLRRWIVRRRQAAFVDTFGDEGLPQRKVTVRRGRVVEHSKYLSLTGSKYGLNAFGTGDGDGNSRAGARSKSPFEWFSTLTDRSQSRISQITQTTTANETPSIYRMLSSPNAQRVYQRRDLNYSSTRVAATNNGDGVTVSFIDEPTSPSPIVRNFSRSFSRHGNLSNFFPCQPTLSSVEEFSTYTFVIGNRRSYGAKYASKERDTKTSMLSMNAQLPAMSQFPHPPQREHQEEVGPKVSSTDHEPLQYSHSEALQVPSGAAHNITRSSSGKHTLRRPHASSHNSLVGSTQMSRQPSDITALPEAPTHVQINDCWDTKSVLDPVRSSRQKDKVLRKKALRKAEMVT
ncbi:hypothetical protein PMZ80_011137 [Knufia obscura]|uniref:Uncharacterized protein n=1 Tax=Knufia obscura TaxID=1635080 RepID=A0ABR0R8Y8_9EURO|nr:hypothetical protein PMZ80_011137 [Knufia obscura]